ncbi:glycoside hydrolase/phage tail family protein [Bosea sp. 117]|uniref:baseplate multidomain protein megatron n=1 Tax=Bosea sp. 117 TaxID=1125973 RepID=UPI0004944487|nr:glycoside hydrolase/phage tail family protein [Bosea sp. 117]
MATLLLGAAAGALGGAVFGPIGALAGRALGALGGAVVDRALFTPGTHSEGPRLADLDVMSAMEGAALPRLYGRARLSGQVIWAPPFEEVVSTETRSAGGKGTAFSAPTTTTTYSYFASFAVGLCEGPITRIGRVWADGKLLDLAGLSVRAHLGGEGQLPDPLIEAWQASAGTPAYRGLAYVVFERLPLADFGNRLPQIAVEVERAIGDLEPRVRAVTMIPGATEFGYATQPLQRVEGPGTYAAENRHILTADTDFEASLDHLVACCPNLERVALVVSWFGTDLRAGQCRVEPGVELRDRETTGPDGERAWSVAGRTRADAHLVSSHDGKAAYGGSPSDDSVIEAIAALNARGLKVTLYPFVMMDVPVGNALPDPWSDAASQPSYPWRGRITCHPAPGRPGSPDGTSTAATQVASLFGTAAPGDFSVDGGALAYSGPDEWTLRRMVLHYAHLSVLAGGVEAILVGSEMAALTRVRSASGVYPAADAFAALAADVKSVVGAETLVSYAADWTEYGAHVLGGGAEVRFPLDVVWSAPAVDFIAVDWYAPIADWREGDAHLDATWRSTYEPAYLKGNVNGGEGFDWYYADEAGRIAQDRIPITDGAYDEAWLFRQKDLANWWSRHHHERIGGVRQASPTAYPPTLKPLRLTEIGCGAVDKGANRPSVFPDPKSVEGGLPPFSNGQRDDLMQRRHLEATLDAFLDDAVNPTAPLPGGRMLDPGAIYLWTWDARPYPVFPLASDVWADGANWQTGHWLTGRFGSAPLAELCETVAADCGIALDAGDLRGVVDGYVIDRPMSVRAALEPLARPFGFDLAERDGGLAMVQRGGRVAALIDDEDLVAGEDGASLRLSRGAEGELPRAITIGFLDGLAEYRRATASSRRLAGAARIETSAELAMVADDAVMTAAADLWLQDLWAGRDAASFALPPSRLALEPGDVVRLSRDGRAALFEITDIEDTEARRVSARSIDPNVFAVATRAPSFPTITLPPALGRPVASVLALPTLSAGRQALAWLAAYGAPWPGAMAVWRALDGASFERVATLAAPSVMGETLTDLPAGPLWRWQRGASLNVRLHGGLLAAASEEAVLDGANALALVAPDGTVEVLQFAEAMLIGTRTFRLSGFLRGQLGTEAAAGFWPAGTRIVRVDGNIAPVASGLDLLGRTVRLRVGRADRDHGDPAVREVSADIGPRALLPLAPVHARARRTGSGVALSWIRRTRVDGDSWDAAEVPLGEASEAYRVEIMDGAAVRRAFEVAAPSVLYAAADELADFGAPQASLHLRIAQRSATAGPGAALDVWVVV